MKVGVIQPDSGNITSVCDALDRLGAPWVRLRDPKLDGLTHLLLPGQGRFAAVMAFLDSHRWIDPIREWMAWDRPFLGICVGMQVLLEGSDEDPGVPGLGIFDGQLRRVQAFKCPMMGWAWVHWRELRLTDGAAYFVNSFVLPTHREWESHSEYGSPFCSAIRRGRCLGVQFHPEKSGAWGEEVFGKWLDS